MPNIITKKYNNFGEAFVNALADRRLDQRWIANNTDIPEDQISRYATNKHTPGKTRIKLFGKLLGVEFVKLQSGDWEVRTKTEIQQAIDAVSQVGEQAISYRDAKPVRGDLLKQLELAESLIRNSRKLLEGMNNSGSHQ